MKDTREKIIDTAIAVFNNDYSSSLEQVAERTGITRRTLHRYFTDRAELLAACQKEMRISCSRTMNEAINSTTNPVKQLERILYAGIDCGTKYAFFQKLHQQHQHHHDEQNEDCSAYDETREKTLAVIKNLQEDGFISTSLTLSWVSLFLSGMIATTINAADSGTIARNDIKSFAWLSFSKGIGLQ